MHLNRGILFPVVMIKKEYLCFGEGMTVTAVTVFCIGPCMIIFRILFPDVLPL